MANPTLSHVTLATLDAQVKAIDRDYQDLRKAVIALDNKLDATSIAMSNRFDTAIAGVSSKLDARSTTPWQAIFGGLAVVVAILVALGTALYTPIQRDTSRLDGAVAAILDRGVFQRQYDVDLHRVAGQIQELRTSVANTIQQQRYNTDQGRLTSRIEEMDKIDEMLRLRSYDQNTRLSRVEAMADGTNKRLDIISARLAALIRDLRLSASGGSKD